MEVCSSTEMGALEGSEIDTDLARWIEWALAQADRLDPLKPTPPSILDEKAKCGVY
jgi:hypothetical protein